jgi:hypothetical protein
MLIKKDGGDQADLDFHQTRGGLNAEQAGDKAELVLQPPQPTHSVYSTAGVLGFRGL